MLLVAAGLPLGCARPRATPWHRVPDSVEAPPDIDVASYAIDARLDGAHRVIDATARIRWRNTSSRPVADLWWHLYMNAFEHDRTLFLRSGAFTRWQTGAPLDPGGVNVSQLRLADGTDLLARTSFPHEDPHDRTEWHTTLPAPVDPGASIEIAVAFRTTLPGIVARTGRWHDLAFVAQWFPKLAVLERDGTWAHFPYHPYSEFYADFGTYDVTLRVPEGDVVAASGVEASAPERARGIDRHTFVARHVHDFAWTAWNRYGETWRTIDGIAVRSVWAPGLESVSERALDALTHAAPFFRERFGAYPYAQLTVVSLPRGARAASGME